MNNSCRICGDNSDHPSYQTREMMFGFRDIFTYFECLNCGCLQIENIPENLSKYYPPAYYSYTSTPDQFYKNPVKNIIKRMRDHYAVFKKGIIGKIIYSRSHKCDLKFLAKTNIAKKSKILDVGSGAGMYLYALKNMGFNNVLGVDPYIPDNILYRNGLKILKNSIFDIKEKWDLIMFNHSFEHVPEQTKTLEYAGGLLNNRGVCVLRMPISSSYAWRHYLANWVNLEPPRHFFLHSLKSLNILASKSRLRVLDVVYDSTDYQFWGSEQFAKDIPLFSENSLFKNPSKSIFSPQQIESFRRMAKQLNEQKQGDSAVFYLTKQN